MTTSNDTLMTVTTTTTFRDLPHDVLLNIVENLDSNAAQLVQVGLVSKFISHICFKKLWHTPLCKSALSFKLLLSTLLLDELSTAYPYRDFLMGISIDFMQQPLAVFDLLELSSQVVQQPFPIKTLQLANVQASVETSQQLIRLFNNTQTLREIHLSHCCTEIVTCLANTAVNTPYTHLTRLCIQDCHVSDRWVQQFTCWTPQLRYFSSQRSGSILSDAAIIAIARHCSFLETLIVTLPNHIIQSNTITMLSLQSISNHCHDLKRLICRGQVRIATKDCQDWLYAHCPSLEYCDLSF